MKNTKLISKMKEHLKLHKSRIIFLILLIEGLIKARSVNLSKVACYISGGKGGLEAKTQRIYRFFRFIVLDPVVWAKLLLALGAIPKSGRLELIVDRTNWKRGKKDLNFLVLALKYRNQILPLISLPIPEQGAGAHALKQLEAVIEIISKAHTIKKIHYLLGDREFGNPSRIRFFQKWGIPFVVRLKEQWHWAHYEGRLALLHTFFKDLQVGRSKTLHNITIGERHTATCSVSVKRLSNGELLIVAHDPSILIPLKIYKNRWSIECLFSYFKTKGFNLEQTGLYHPERLANLLAVLALAVLIIFAQALMLLARNPSILKFKKHGYYHKSLFSIGLYYLICAPPDYWISFFDSLASLFSLRRKSFVG